VNFDRLPKYGPEDTNLCAVVDKQISTDSKVEKLYEQVNAIVAGDIAVNTAHSPVDDRFVAMFCE